MNRLKKYRIDHNLTQKQMAKMLNISNSCYSLYENNKREMPYKTLIKFLEIRNEGMDNCLNVILKDFLRK